MSRRIVALALVVIALLGTLFYTGTLWMSESLYSSRGTFAYWLTISSIIKAVPEVHSTAQPRFYSSAGDGPKLQESAITYPSASSPTEIQNVIDRYLASKGYRKRPEGDYLNGESVVSIEIETDSKGNVVTVRENY